MKIISKGRLPESKPWRGTCTNCSTIAEAEQGELKVTYDQRDGEFGEAPCPYCKYRMIFYPKD